MRGGREPGTEVALSSLPLDISIKKCIWVVISGVNLWWIALKWVPRQYVAEECFNASPTRPDVAIL